MPKYADGITEAKIGDVVRCVYASGSTLYCDEVYTITHLDGDLLKVTGQDIRDSFMAHRFELIRRQEETMNGKYASGEEPQVGDIVECIDSHGYHVKGEKYLAWRFNEMGNLVSLNSDHGTAPCRFKLIRRKEQPMSDPQPGATE